MCGIVGFNGKHQATPVLLAGLSKLEYRGYDSAGIAVRNGAQTPKIIKTKGRVLDLTKKTMETPSIVGTCGIGHTRWATHGEPSERNAHPHFSENVILVHNGIIENHEELKKELLNFGYSFYSQTDTEIAVKLLDFYQKKHQNPIPALTEFIHRVRGSYALAILFREFPESIYAVRKESPMIIATTNEESFLASDVCAIPKQAKTLYYMENLEIACLKKGEVEFYNLAGNKIIKKSTPNTYNLEDSGKDGYPHFMLKEIYEQPKAVEKTLNFVLYQEKIDLSRVGLSREKIQKIRQICIVACGSAYHAGVAIQYVFEKLAKIPVRVELASEFRYRNPVLSQDTLVIVISQSGETADSLAALREGKGMGLKTLAIVNVEGSSIAREADYAFYTQAGPEIAVATTKAYSTQLVAGYLLALEFAHVFEKIDQAEYERLLLELKTLPKKIEILLKNAEKIHEIAKNIAFKEKVFFIGRGIDYALSLEGSLKLKEISYIHSEAYAAGELKHGTISLIEEGVPVIGILTQGELYEKTLGNLTEVKSRGAEVIAVSSEDCPFVDKVAVECLYIPKMEGIFSASLAVIPLQLLSYYVSVQKGLDVDKPRNLAKSVTVE